MTAPQDKVVLVLPGTGANNAIQGMMAEFSNALSAYGVNSVHITFDPSEVQYAIDLMAKGGVRFALTWLGIGQDISVTDESGRELSAWDALRVPLVKIHADHPAYFSDRHRDLPRNAVNLYMAAEFMEFRRRWLPDERALTGLVPPWPIAPIPRDDVDLRKRRNGKLVFLKNGNAAGDLRRLWRGRLAPTLADLLDSMADAIGSVGLRPGKLLIGDFVATFIQERGVDPDSAASMMPFFTAQLDDYLRRVKSEMIARAVLDFPVIVQGDLWDHVDFRGRRALLVPGEDFMASRRVFADELGVIDMSPNMDSEPHDRMQRAAGSYSLVLSNKQTWITDEFPGFDDITFEFDPESIKARVADVLARPEHYLELGVAFGERFRKVHPMEAFSGRVVAMADLAALRCAAEKPVLQPFFVWPER
ncbi:MAG: hypothetical protein C5B46_03050 [Proteobacteria bacterium]|nr:MAG: hypothetical protein C5B46_03050 [Pseudomonadota bacterium]